MKKYLILLISFSFLLLTVVVKRSLDYREKLHDCYSEPYCVLRVVIDPGHGGIDGGCVSIDGTYEKDINLQVSLLLCEYLNARGIEVILTRIGDYDLASEKSTNRKREDIHKRVEVINESQANLYISIHCNSFPQKSVRGAQVFYRKNDKISKQFATYIQNSLVKNLKNTKRNAKMINDKFLVDNSKVTGCLIEIGFLSNEEELSLLKEKDYKLKLCESIYMGMVNFINSY